MSVGGKSKLAVWKRDNGCCFYCDEKLSWENKTVDHVIPRSKGGPHRIWNLVLACKPCNETKGDNDPTEEQLDIVMKRKLLHETMISVGQAIGYAKQQRNADEVAKLLNILWDVQDLIASR